MGEFFYDHLNKKDSKLILVIKSFGCVFTLISYRGTFKLKRRENLYLNLAGDRKEDPFNVYVYFNDEL